MPGFKTAIVGAALLVPAIAAAAPVQFACSGGRSSTARARSPRRTT